MPTDANAPIRIGVTPRLPATDTVWPSGSLALWPMSNEAVTSPRLTLAHSALLSAVSFGVQGRNV